MGEKTHPPRVIIIDGIIGAGKTVLATCLADELKSRGWEVCVILEPVKQWVGVGILQLFYSDPVRYGYSFQSFVYATRVMAIELAVRVNPHADFYILERSPVTDAIFMELQRGVIDPVEFKMYESWRQAWKTVLSLETAQVLFLRTSLETCMSRIALRNRDGEIRDGGVRDGGVRDGGVRDGETCDGALPATATGGVSIEYQKRLQRAHEAFFQRLHKEDFPLMPECPFASSALIEIGPELADANYCDKGAEQARVINTIIGMLGV